MGKTQKQLLTEALELIGMIDGLKDTHVPKIIEFMLIKQFIDTGEPVTDNMVIIGNVMTTYQKALITLSERTRIAHNLRAEQFNKILHFGGEPNHEMKETLSQLQTDYDSLESSLWKSIHQTHGECHDFNKRFIVVEGFRIAEVPFPVCENCGETHS